jgi:cbb3-type cytochrome oxidase maturation protein
MSVIYLLISISIVVAIGFFVAFILAVKSGQYDDDYTPSVRMLFDDELRKTKTKTKLKTDEKQI